ncbi:DUF1028 domain-containing protein [Natrialba sp. SSL1]|uniref:DUF1028 domain-containing protein n=1 Tax=Natrialba sp. SSL1 TaxID=1869245 RepID=UPI0008F83D0D|nr:DUF1028 domain-containing protein [Natrialba sp. SSL1]OIB58097.1 hypothetical protein BBD46_10585 [Natrialba sp. SSL1]
MTFSIVGRDPDSQTIGVAIASVFPAVGAVCPYVGDGVAFSSQSWDSGYSYGGPITNMVENDISLPTACETVLSERDGAAGTQLHGIDMDGNSFVYTGEKSKEWAGHATGPNHTAAGNLLIGDAVIEAMGRTFERTDGRLEERLLAALEAGEDEGGDKRGNNLSAALLTHGPEPKLSRNLRVDDPGNPIDGLRRAYEVALETDRANEDSDNEAWGENPPASLDTYEIKY